MLRKDKQKAMLKRIETAVNWNYSWEVKIKSNSWHANSWNYIRDQGIPMYHINPNN